MKVPEPKKLPSGKWFIQLRLDGESISISDYSKKECVKKATLAKAEHLAEKKTRLEEPTEEIKTIAKTLPEAIDDYILQRTNTLSPGTIRGYRIIQKNRFKDIATRDLFSIKPEEWQGIVNIEAGTCSPKTLKNAWGFIRSVIEDTTGSFPPEVRLPAVAPSDKPYLTPDQIKIFIAAVKDTKYAIPSYLALDSLRISEIQALDWADIPKNPDFIHVRGAVVLDENNNKVKKKQNKNSTSTRDVPILIPELAEVLERDRRSSGPVMPYHQNSLRVALAKIYKAHGLPNVGIHGLRHSFASLAYYLEIPERDTMAIGGWSDLSTMHKIYTHISNADINRYSNKLADFYRQRD
jgi:integrase